MHSLNTPNTLYKQAWHRFSPEFRDFWIVTPGPALLTAFQQSHCESCSLVRGWSRGGCKVWLEGVKRWVTRSGRTAQWIESARVYAVATDETDAAHVLFSLSLGGKFLFVDSKGVWTSQELKVRLAQEYQYDDHWLLPWEQGDPHWGTIPYDPEIVSSLEEALFRIVGPFTPSHFLAFPDPVTV